MTPPKNENDIRTMVQIEEKSKTLQDRQDETDESLKKMSAVLQELVLAVNSAKATAKFVAWFVPIFTSVAIAIFGAIGNYVISDLTSRLSRLENIHIGEINGKR